MRHATNVLALLLAVTTGGLASFAVPHANAAEYACKHNSPTTNIECRPRSVGAWWYQPFDFYGASAPVESLWSEDEAVGYALGWINSGYGYNNFCRYDYTRVSSPYVPVTWDAGIVGKETSDPVTDGIVWAGNYCATGIVTQVGVSRLRGIFCQPGWFNGFDGLGGKLCYRDSNSPPSCPAPGTPGGGGSTPWSGPGASDPAWIGNPVNAHTGDKLQDEVDYASGGPRPLEIRRTYLSTGFPWLINVSAPRFGLGDYWRTPFDQRLVQYAGTSQTTMIAYRSNNAALYFYRSGTSWAGRPEQSESLADVLDGGGAVVERALMLADNSRETYDLDGRLTSIRGLDGWTQLLAYDAGGRLQTVTDSMGRVLSFAYDASGRLVAIATPDGQSISYAYDAKGYLASVTYPGGGQRQYLYMESENIANTSYYGLLTGIVDENGSRFATYKYDSNGRVSQTEHGGGANRYQYSYGTTASVTDPLGTVRTLGKTNVKGFARTTSVSQPCAGCGGGAASALTYDAVGNVASRTDFNGRKTCYAYDTTRNLETARVEGLTAAEDCAASLASPPARPDVRKVTTGWHATRRQPASIVEPAPGGTKTTAFTYDAAGNLTQTKTTAPKNDGTSTTITRTWKWTVGTFGRVLTATDPNNKVATTTYHADDDPDPGRRRQIATVTSRVGHVTQFTAYDAAGRLTSMTDPNGMITTMSYGPRGQLTSRDVGGEVTTYAYDLAGQLIGVEMPDGSTLGYVYDEAHRLTEVHDGPGNRIVYTLDGMGNRTKEEAFDPQGILARTRSRVYDGLNRLAREIGAQAQTTVHTYDGNGNRLTTTDPLSHATTSSYDALKRLLTMTDPGLGVTSYAHDNAGNLTGVTDSRDLTTTYGHDGLGNPVSQVSPDTGITTRTFDAAGNVKTSTDARGAKATTTYDAAGRVTKVVHSQTGFTSETHTYTWDGGTAGAANAKGRMTQLVDPSGTTKWSWTAQGRVSSRQQVAGGVTLTTGYAWTDGRLTGMTTPSGQSIGYGYANGRITGITVNGSPLIVAGEYEPFGPVAVWQWGNGHRTYRDHDSDGRLSSWEYRNGASIVRRDFTWDEASRITAVSDPADPTESGTYGYDALDRLTSALTGGTNRTYGYDAIGNRTTSSVDAESTSYGYEAASHRLRTLTGATTRSYAYDGAGNPIQVDGRTATYSLANRLAKLADGAATVATYKLNGLGQRVAKAVGGTTTRYVYDEQGRLTGEYQANGTLIQETVWLDDLPVATLRPTGSGNPTPVAVYYVHADHLGSPRAITRPSDDAILWRWDNDEPFGNNQANENPAGLGTFRYDLRFPGQQYDAETGTHYNYFRDYDPIAGRYLQSDPIGLRGAINTFLYVSGAPLRWIDPRGLRVFACTRSAFGPPERAMGNHTYLFDDVSGRFCGMQQSSGLGGDPRHGERGPGGGDSCVEIPNAESVASNILNCCEARNRGPWIPFANDCFTVANSCVDSYLPGPNPRAPGERFRTDCNSCWKPQPQPAFAQ